ncbi:MAG: DUF1786 domain-containing protein [Chloroflexi bacterium]|nr:DUF1786 domain-containing protein [Chloroflexota bacterium]
MTGAADTILAIDIGAGTQDILLYQARQPMENNIKLVLPSPTTLLARRIERATREGCDVFLTGNLMGGGPCVSALKRHIRAGFRAFATPRAAKTIRNNPEQVRAYGIEIVDAPPPGNVVVLETRDVDLSLLQTVLTPFDVTLPDTIAIAVQDHGECLSGSNRRFRFQLWREFIEGGGRLEKLAYRKPPAQFTRMCAVQEDAPGAIVMDTGAAAIWGALCDEQVSAHRDEGLVILNVGNQHVLGALVQRERIWGLFEHHTVLVKPEKLANLVARLQEGALTNEEVYTDGGHGAFIHEEYPGGFNRVAVTGPNRAMARGLGYYMAVPYGDMMLSGAFGLVAATRRLLSIGEGML